jgi:hypothetical protein
MQKGKSEASKASLLFLPIEQQLGTSLLPSEIDLVAASPLEGLGGFCAHFFFSFAGVALIGEVFFATVFFVGTFLVAGGLEALARVLAM